MTKKQEQRIKTAQERQEFYDALTPQQKIDLLDKRGVKAEKQRAKLMKLVQIELLKKKMKGK